MALSWINDFRCLYAVKVKKIRLSVVPSEGDLKGLRLSLALKIISMQQKKINLNFGLRPRSA